MENMENQSLTVTDEEETKPKRKGRRPGTKNYPDIPAYQSNPFTPSLVEGMKTKKRIITARGGASVHKIIVDTRTGEEEGIAGFYNVKEVDAEQFAKIYAKGMAVFAELSNPGMKAFGIMHGQLLGDKKYGVDRIFLDYDMLPDVAQGYCSKRTWLRGIRELLEKKVIARTTNPYMYWLNPHYIFYGDRLAIADEYVLREPNMKNVTSEGEVNDIGGENDNASNGRSETTGAES